ncbi:MAG TPA: ABC transporter substrate-binding protein [Xanthobacteraceae bacterium]|jgi:NitT/TauT family transport system substrate-binding protein
MMSSRTSFRLWISALAALTSATLVGPWGDIARAADKLSVAVIPIGDCAPIYLGIAKGFFAKQNLEIDLSTAGGGAAIIPGVLSGQMQFGFSNIPSLLIAQTKGLQFVGVAPGASSTGERGHDFSAIIAAGDSSIKTAKDLEGKTVAVNNLNNIGDTSVRAGVRAAGGDPAKVRFIEVPFPDMPAAIAEHRIEAGWVVEPFLTIALSRGAKVVDWNLVDVAPKMMIAAYFTSAKYAQEHPDIVNRFKAAITESLAYADSHSDEVRKIIPTYTRISPDVAAKITLPRWPTEMNRPSSQALADDALKDGLISKKADIAALLP